MPHLPDCLLDEVTASVNEGRTVGVMYLHLWKTLDMVFLNILVPKLGQSSLDGLTKRWVKHQLDDEAESAVKKGSYPTWRPMGHIWSWWGSTGDSPGTWGV